jgi:uncharacterized protein
VTAGVGTGADPSLAALEAELAELAVRALGPRRVVAFTAASETYLPEELAVARDLAARLGVAHEVVRTTECEDEAFAANPRDRCYICKSHLLAEMARVAAAHGCAALVDGANLDDLGDVRPGLRAAGEVGVVHPLVAAGLGKAEVRRLARHLGLPTWDAPQQACLASRVPYGEPITAEKLRAIAAAEAVLRELGFRQCRVRHHGAVARVEVETAEIERAAGVSRDEIVRRLREIGFTYVALDLRGFRSGSMNEA